MRPVRLLPPFSPSVILAFSPPVILDISNRGSSPVVVFGIRSPASDAANGKRHEMAPPHGACGRGCAPVPKSIWGRGLSERSEFRSPSNRDRGKGTRRATPGRPWFWVLLPKQKDLAVRGRNPARTFSPSVIPDLIRDPEPLSFAVVAASVVIRHKTPDWSS